MLSQASSQLASGEYVTATEVITQILRLHQVVCGHVVDEKGLIHDVHSNRIASLLEVLEETQGQAIVWSAYRYTIPKIVEALSKHGEVVEYHGGAKNEERLSAIEKF